jgi:hypothetical protein
MRRFSWLVLASLVLTAVPLATPAGATTDIILKIDDIAGESQHDCNDTFCSPEVIAYAFIGTDAVCVQRCSGWPTDPTSVSLHFSITKVAANNRCKAKAGTGTLDLQWPNDVSTPVAHGTFTFKARDSKTLAMSGQMTSSTVPLLIPPNPWHGTITFPPSPCVGGTSSATIAFASSA